MTTEQKAQAHLKKQLEQEARVADLNATVGSLKKLRATMQAKCECDPASRPPTAADGYCPACNKRRNRR
ncbi:hypothetical protein [Allokutzneria oryzae]|uniref:Uncharacterized protein n=1 Tax=Allokutzneria oryzae TaxID=1378989 RepID=A0ABV6A1E5_9PSEU